MTTPPDHSAEDAELALAIIKYGNSCRVTNLEWELDSIGGLIATARRAEREELVKLTQENETIRALLKLASTLKAQHMQEIASLKQQITYDTECIERITNHGLELEQEIERLKAQVADLQIQRDVQWKSRKYAESKLTAATAALEMCDRNLKKQLEYADDAEYNSAKVVNMKSAAQQALAAIKEVKDKH